MDFVNLNRLGERYRRKHFTIIVKRNGLDISRLGITVNRKTGNAVKRNKVKRLIREYFRLNKKRFPRGYDIVIVAKKGADDLIYGNMKEELGEIIVD